MTEGRHSGMDCRNRQTAQRIQAPWEDSKLAIHGTGYPLHAGYDGLSSNLTK